MTTETNRSQCCYGCATKSETQRVKCCPVCKSAFYGSKECQGEHGSTHKIKCKPYICGSSRKGGRQSSERRNNKKRNKIPSVRELVGRKCLIRCFLGDKIVEALWDSGSQVCAIDEVWKETNLPEVPLKNVNELIDPNIPLHLEAANGTDMPYVGWLEVPFKLFTNDSELLIPVLVLKGNQQRCPIIGFNVIEHLVLDSLKGGTDSGEKDKLLRAVKLAFPQLRKNKVTTFIKAISEGQTNEYDVRTTKERVTVPSHSSVFIECRLRHSEKTLH